MSYFNGTGVKRSRRNAGLSPAPTTNELSAQSNITTLPDEIYQHIFGYILGNDVKDIFYFASVKLVNKTFQRIFRSYLKTNPLLILDLHGDYSSLQLLKVLKRIFNVSSIYSLNLEYPGDDVCLNQNIIKELCGFNLTSLRKLHLTEEDFGLEILQECNQLTSLALEVDFIDSLDEVRAEKFNTFLSLNKDTLEYLEVPLLLDGESYHDVIPKDLSSWSKLKKLFIFSIYTKADSQSKVIESSTLQWIHINYLEGDMMVIKCPNLKVLYIESIDRIYDHGVELEERACNPHDKEYVYFNYTCHPSKLRKIGMVLEVSSDCDIFINP